MRGIDYQGATELGDGRRRESVVALVKGTLARDEVHRERERERKSMRCDTDVISRIAYEAGEMHA